MNREVFLPAVAVIFSCISPARAEFKPETFFPRGWLGQAAAVEAPPAATAALAAAARAGLGRAVDFTVEPAFGRPEELEARGADVSLIVRRRFGGPPDEAFEATGDLFGRTVGLADPLVFKKETFGSRASVIVEGAGGSLALEKETFGSRASVIVEGAGGSLALERVAGWDRLDARTDQGYAPETTAVLLAVLEMLPAAPPAPAVGAAQAPALASYGLRAVSPAFFRAEGIDVNLDVRMSPVGTEDREYRVTGSAFGRTLGYGIDEFVLSTDKAFLGEKGLRVRGPGMDLELRVNDFGGRPRLEVRGSPGDSRELMLFTLALARFIAGE